MSHSSKDSNGGNPENEREEDNILGQNVNPPLPPGNPPRVIQGILPERSSRNNVTQGGNWTAAQDFMQSLDRVLVTDHADSLTKAYNSMRSSGVVCRLGKAIQIGDGEAFVGLLGFYQKNEINVLLQITEFQVETDVFRVTEVVTEVGAPEVVMSMSKTTLESMGAVQVCMMESFKRSCSGLPYSGVPKGVRMGLAEDGHSAVLWVGCPSGAGVQIPLPLGKARGLVADESVALPPPPHHLDPMKQRVRALPGPTVAVLLGGKYDSVVCSNRGIMDVYSALAGGGLSIVQWKM